MRYRTLAIVTVLTIICSGANAVPAGANEWRSHDRGRGRQRDVDPRMPTDHQQRLDQQQQADQPYWGTMRPYWGTMHPYWGPNDPPGVIHNRPRTQDLSK